MRRALIVFQLPVALLVLYLDLLSVAATLRRRTAAPAAPRHRFAILVPAHDEELLLPRLLESIGRMDYPRALYDVHVVADNCTDRTADVAAGAGAMVHERRDAHVRGKGYALRWLLARLHERAATYHAYVILDADSVVSTNFLGVLNAHLVRGDQVVQSYYGVLNREESWPATLRHVALSLFNDLRPRGRDALGLSAGLRGNGMCFAAPILDRFGWEAFALAEDAEFHLHLVRAGIKVTYAPEASVLAEMPASLRQARSQNVRWERGRLQLLRSFGLPLLAEGIRKRDPVRLEAIAEQLVPPLSVLTGVATCTVVATAALRRRGAHRLAFAVLLGQLAYVCAGLRLARATPRTYAALLWAPCYVVWKIWIYAMAAVGIRDSRWIRTARRATGTGKTHDDGRRGARHAAG